MRTSRRSSSTASRKLADEFDAVPAASIGREVDAIANRLAGPAHFDDYIPVLAHRLTREELRDHRVEQQPRAA
jgi:hypothetical protein